MSPAIISMMLCSGNYSNENVICESSHRGWSSVINLTFCSHWWWSLYPCSSERLQSALVQPESAWSDKTNAIPPSNASTGSTRNVTYCTAVPNWRGSAVYLTWATKVANRWLDSFSNSRGMAFCDVSFVSSATFGTSARLDGDGITVQRPNC